MSLPGAVLDAIVARTRERIRAGGYDARPPAGAGNGSGARFVASLREPGPRVIAEIKRRSPSAGEIVPHAERKIESIALAYRRGHAAAISVVTEPEFFGGDAGWIARAGRISGLPVLMKDFLLEESQLDFAAARGADAVLLIAAVLGNGSLARLASAASSRGLAVVAEVHSEEELPGALDSGAEVIGVNSRDLATFMVDPETPRRLAAGIPDRFVRLAESGIRTRADVEALSACGYSAFLVGEALLRSKEPEAALRALQGKA
jgi:indole-3-glycerol phosphate synthase